MGVENNPFLYGKTASDLRFCNRKKEISELRRFLSSRSNVWLYSPRKFGKTSLVKKLFEILADEEKIKTIYIDIFDTASETDFAMMLAGAASNQIVGRAESALKAARRIFHYLVPVLTVDDSGRPEITIGTSRARDEVHVDRVLNSLEEYAKSEKKTVILAIDEFQQVGRYDSSEMLEARIRKAIQSHENVSYIFLGSQKHLMEEIFTVKKRPLYQSAVSYRLGFIPSEELVEMMLGLTKKTADLFDRGLAGAIVKMTEGHPFNTEKFAFYAFNMIGRMKEYKDAQEFLSAVIEDVLEREESIYKNNVNLLTPRQFKVLAAIAHYGGKIPSNEMVREYGLSSRQYLDKTLRFFIKHELVDAYDQSVTIYDMFFKKWLARHARR